MTDFAHAPEATRAANVSLLRLLWGRRPDPLERWTRIREEHPHIARYRYGLTDSYLVTSAEAAKHVLQDNAAGYTKEHPAYFMLRRLFGNGLFTSEGSFWLRQRRLAQPAFHRQRLATMGAGMTGAALEAADRWDAHVASGEPMSILREMSRVTLKAVGDALFGTGLSEKSSVVQAAWDVLNAQLVERFGKMRLLPPILPTRYDRAFRDARRTLFGVVDEIIAARRASGAESDDLLSMLMHARDEDTGERMTDGQLRDEVVTMLVAGHETTAVALAWTWALLDTHRDVAASLRAELARVLGGRAPLAEDVPNLPFTRAVVEESLRLHPPAYVFHRRVAADDVVCGKRVHAGAALVICPVILHRHPDYWERPDEFSPDRWMNDSAKARPRFAFIPFSAGPRQCIGNAFSMMESILVLATLAQRFDPRLVVPGVPATEYLVLARPKGDVMAHVAPVA